MERYVCNRSAVRDPRKKTQKPLNKSNSLAVVGYIMLSNRMNKFATTNNLNHAYGRLWFSVSPVLSTWSGRLSLQQATSSQIQVTYDVLQVLEHTTQYNWDVEPMMHLLCCAHGRLHSEQL